MGIFTKKNDPVVALSAARSVLDKANTAFHEAVGRSREAIERFVAANDRITKAKELGVESASRGEEPESLAGLESELHAAQVREAAFSKAVGKAEAARDLAKVQYIKAEKVETAHRYGSIAKRFENALDAAAAIHSELIEVWSEDPKSLPMLAWPEFSPNGHLEWFKASLTEFMAPSAEAVAPPSDYLLVRFVKTCRGGSGFGSIGAYGVGEKAGFAKKQAQFLIDQGYAVLA
jgi:hypothetical protein